MPLKDPGTSYTGKPVRRLKLPKIGPTKTTSLFEEYFYLLLALVFLSVAVLGKAGGFSTYNALIVAAWITALIWFAHQWRGYLAEKSKPENEKTVPPQAPAAAQKPKGPVPLPPGMKPMIGPQWPVRASSRPVWPKVPKEQPTTGAPSPAPAVRPSPAQAQLNQTSETNSTEKKRSFVYERPTLPDRAPKLPNNWANRDDKKAKNKKPKR